MIKKSTKGIRSGNKRDSKSRKVGSKPTVPAVQGYEYWANRKPDDKEKDWRYNENSWLEGYVLSIDHEHRQQILDALKTFYPFGGVLEIGCNTGSNLIRISTNYPENQMAGIDANGYAIQIARQLLPKAILEVGDYENLPFETKAFDIVLADAVLLYAGPEKINKVLDEMDRVSKKGLILVERYAPSVEGEVVGHVWGYDYKTLLETRGFIVEESPVLWESSPNWQKFGRIWVARR